MTCRLCGQDAPGCFETSDRNRRMGDARFTYCRCSACGTVQLEDVPADLGAWYPDTYFAFPTATELDGQAGLERHKLDAIRAHVPAGRLVEIGPGFGAFARVASRAGYEVRAIEMDARCCAHLRTELGIEAIESDAPEAELATLPPSDAIALWHALEHVPDPVALVAAAARNLRPGGVLALAVPNPEAFQFRVLGARWPHVDAPRHLHLIPARTLAAHAAAAGLELVSVTSDDDGARYWNAFGWARFALPPSPRWALAAPADVAGRAVAWFMRPRESQPLRGSAYTMVLRRPR